MADEKKDERVISYGQMGGITARNVQINATQPPRDINTADLRGALAYILEKRITVKVAAAIGDNEALQYATQIVDFLRSHGINVVGDAAIYALTAKQPLELFLGENPPLLLVGPR